MQPQRVMLSPAGASLRVADTPPASRRPRSRPWQCVRLPTCIPDILLHVCRLITVLVVLVLVFGSVLPLLRCCRSPRDLDHTTRLPCGGFNGFHPAYLARCHELGIQPHPKVRSHSYNASLVLCVGRVLTTRDYRLWTACPSQKEMTRRVLNSLSLLAFTCLLAISRVFVGVCDTTMPCSIWI